MSPAVLALAAACTIESGGARPPPSGGAGVGVDPETQKVHVDPERVPLVDGCAPGQTVRRTIDGWSCVDEPASYPAAPHGHGDCSAGEWVVGVGANGAVMCARVPDPEFGAGLAVEGEAVAVAFAGNGAVDQAARADHRHTEVDGAVAGLADALADVETALAGLDDRTVALAPGGPGAAPGAYWAEALNGCAYDPGGDAVYWVNHSQWSLIRFDLRTRAYQPIWWDTGTNFGSWAAYVRAPETDAPEIWFGHSTWSMVRRVATTVPPFGTTEPAGAADFTLPFLPGGLAEAGRAADGGAGGYTGDVADFFALQGNALVRWNMGGGPPTTLVPDLVAATQPRAPQMVARSPLMQGLHHDPGSRRLLLNDSNNGMIWVFGYDAPLEAVTLRAVLPAAAGPPACPPGPNCLISRCVSYDPARRTMWTGSHAASLLTALPLDLSRL